MNLRPIVLLFFSFALFACSVQTSNSGTPPEDVIVQSEEFVSGYFKKLTNTTAVKYKIVHDSHGSFLMIQAKDSYTYAWPLRKVKDGYKVKFINMIHASTCQSWSMAIFSFSGEQINGVQCGNHKVCGF